MEATSAVQSSLNWHGRKYRRFRLAFPVRLKVQSGSAQTDIETVSSDLSIGGLSLRSALAIPTQTDVTFVLSVHGRQSLRPTHLIGNGKVVRLEGIEAEAGFIIAIKCESPMMELEEYLPV